MSYSSVKTVVPGVMVPRIYPFCEQNLSYFDEAVSVILTTAVGKVPLATVFIGAMAR
jgi:hypothetical protein